MAGDDAVDEDKVTLCCAVCCANCGIYPTDDCCGCSGKAVSFRDNQAQLVKRSGVILCCSEKSAYDPARGAEVLGGPAKQPLCSILLEYDSEDDSLHALGSYGGEVFDRFFAQFAARLQLEWGTSDVRRPVTGVARTIPVDQYSRTQMMCGA